MFLPAWCRQLLTDARQRRRTSRLTLSEIMMILVYFHQSQYRNFKAFYLLHLCRHYRGGESMHNKLMPLVDKVLLCK